MKFKELDEMWHRIREEIAKEEKDLTLEERVARDNEIGREGAKRLGLKIAKAPDPVGKK